MSQDKRHEPCEVKLTCKATAALQEEIEKELEQKDKAIASLFGTEETEETDEDKNPEE